MSTISYQQFERDYSMMETTLGEGVTGKVYQVIKKKTYERFALKLIQCSDIEQLNTSLAEVEIMARIDHQSIPKVAFQVIQMYYHFLKQETTEITEVVSVNKNNNNKKTRKREVPIRFYFGIIMEYCQISLEQEIAEIKAGRLKPYTFQELWDFMRSMASVLSKMQKMDILHRDIKPANILVKMQGNNKRRWKLCDFAFSTVKNEYSGNCIPGTEEYVSPKVLKKFKNNNLIIKEINAKDDTYSLGKTIIKLVTQKSYHNRDINARLLTKIARTYKSNSFYEILKGIFQQEEKDRWDFIKLDQQIRRIGKLTQQRSIYLDSPNIKGIRQDSNQQNQAFFPIKPFNQNGNGEKNQDAEIRNSRQQNGVVSLKFSLNPIMKEHYRDQKNESESLINKKFKGSQIQSLDKTQPKKSFRIDDFHRLSEAKFRLQSFIEELGQLKQTPIREDVLKYYESQRKRKRKIEVHCEPSAIMNYVQIRTKRIIKNRKITLNWDKEDIHLLLWTISKYCDWKGYNNIEKDLQQEDWRFIATLIPGVTGDMCMFKWLRFKKATLTDNYWSDQEDRLLSRIIKNKYYKGFKHQIQHHQWKQISQQLYELNLRKDKVYRDYQQCKNRWKFFLDPYLKKGKWQLQEDIMMFRLIQANNGLKSNILISKYIGRRNVNSVNGRYALIMRKQKELPENRHKSELDIIVDYLARCQLKQQTSKNQETGVSSSSRNQQLNHNES